MSKAILQYPDLRTHIRRAWCTALLMLCLLAMPALPQAQEGETDRPAEDTAPPTGPAAGAGS